MEREPPKDRKGGAGAPDREDRRKAALKANMARRKAQAKARAAAGRTGSDGDNDKSG